MHLVVLTEDFFPETSGGAHVRWRFCQLAVERGHTVTVFTPHENGLPRSETVNGVDIRRPFRVKPEGMPVYSPIAVITRIAASALIFVSLCWWLRDRDVDGLHSASHLTHWVGKALSVLYGLPIVSFVGYTPSVVPDPPPTPKLFLERVNFRLFMGHTVFCRTPRTKRVIESYVDTDAPVLHGILSRRQITDASYAANRDRRRADLGIDDGDSFLVYVGRLEPLKNPVGAITVLSDLPAEWTLAIVGDGTERDAVERAIRDHDVGDRVRMCGMIPHEKALGTIAAADALVLPSHAESYGAVVFEALALNTLVFATPVGAAPAVDHPRLHTGTIGDLPQLITRTPIDPSDGLDTETLERFSMERYTDELLDSFEGLTSTGSSPGGA